MELGRALQRARALAHARERRHEDAEEDGDDADDDDQLDEGERVRRPSAFPSAGNSGEGRVRGRVVDSRLSADVHRVNPHPNPLPAYRARAKANPPAVPGEE